MKARSFALATLLLGVSIFSTVPACSAENATQVNVALLDMSSFMGSPNAVGYDWPESFSGMMGGGAMGRGMMGNGWGMMGIGPGMMGMGHMVVRADKASAKPGTVHFSVTNWSRAVVHEMLVVAVDSANVPLPYDYNSAKVLEEQVKSMGEVAELKPNESGSLDVTLTPGTYILLCNVPGHYAAGMWTALTVAP